MLDHTGTTSNRTANRIETPENTKYAINLNGKSVTLSKEQSNANGVEKESALVTNLKKSYLTIYNNNGNSVGKDANFADLQYSDKWRNKNRRLQTNIEISESTLNIVGSGSTDTNLSNGGINFYGPLASDTNLNNGEYRQGSINLIGTGGTINLDGQVSLQGVVGVSSWSISGAKTLSGVIETKINLLNNANINTSSLGSSTSGQCEDKADNAIAHGIYIDANNCGGEISISLNGNSSIITECVGSNSPTYISAGIRIENFSGTLIININNSSIKATRGYGIYLNNCSNASISYTGESSISGDKGDIYIKSSTAVINNTTYTTDGVISL